MFLLDTNVVSELRKVTSGKADRHVTRWIGTVDATDLYISAITLLEVEIGILRLERRDPAQGSVLRDWFERRVMPEFGGRILPVDAPVARHCARFHVPDRRSEYDALIAATALVHRMTVVTRNTADFQPTGVPLLNPWTVSRISPR